MHLFHIAKYTIHNRNVYIYVLHGLILDLGQVNRRMWTIGLLGQFVTGLYKKSQMASDSFLINVFSYFQVSIKCITNRERWVRTWVVCGETICYIKISDKFLS